MKTTELTTNKSEKQQIENEEIVTTEDNITTNPLVVQENNGVIENKQKKKKKKKGGRKKKLSASEEIVKNMKYSFRKHVGMLGFDVIMFQFSICGWYIYIIFGYTRFQNFDREWIWLFITMSTLFFLSAIYGLAKWQKIAKYYTAQAVGRSTSNGNDGNQLFLLYRSTFINGKYYLWKLYFIEFIESFNQLNNLITVYSCLLTPGWLIGLCAFLGIDSFVKSYLISKPNTPERRDFQIRIDIAVDFLCMSLPLILIRFVFNMAINATEMVALIWFPSMCLLTKLRSIYREIIRVNCTDIVKKQQSIRADMIGRQRKSIFGNDVCTKTAITQDKMLPRKFKKTVVIYFTIYGICMFIFGIIQLALLQGNDDECNNRMGYYDVDNSKYLWKDGCVLKTPFCTRLLIPKCDCAVLNVNKHNYSVFPKIVLSDMKNIRFIKMNHGPLNGLPNNFKDHDMTKVNKINLNYNGIYVIPENFLSGLKVTYLKLESNHLSSLPGSVWGHEHLVYVDLSNNNISEVHPNIKEAKTMQSLHLSNNTLQILPSEIGETNLIWLCLEGNHFNSIPTAVLKLHRTLHALRLNNQNISKLPEDIGSLRLGELDLRNNNISVLPASFNNFNKLKLLFLHNNPVCKISSEIVKEIVIRNKGDLETTGCVAQCSEYCQDLWLSKKTCWPQCNTPKCFKIREEKYGKVDCA